MEMSKERKKAIDAAISQIERQFGKGSIMSLGERGATREPNASNWCSFL